MIFMGLDEYLGIKEQVDQLPSEEDKFIFDKMCQEYRNLKDLHDDLAKDIEKREERLKEMRKMYREMRIKIYSWLDERR